MAENKELIQNGSGMRAPLSILSVQKGFNPRKKVELDPDFLASVKAHGVQNPVHIRNDPEKPGHFIIVDGEKRFLAAKKTGQDDLPVVPAGELSEADAIVLALIANEGQTPLSLQEKALAYNRLEKQGAGEKEIARVLGTSVRTIREARRVIEEGAPEIKKGVTSKDEKEKIAPRAAARAASLPAKEQKKLAKRLKGKSTKEGIREVQKVEKRLGATKRGRKPRKTPIARDAHARLDTLFYLALSRLRKNPSDERAKGHLEAALVLQGENDVLDLYDGNAKAPKKIVTSKTISELGKALDADAQRQEAKAQREEKQASAKKKIPKRKASSKAGPKKIPRRPAKSKKTAKKPARRKRK